MGKGTLVLLCTLAGLLGPWGGFATFASPLVLTGESSPGPLWPHLELLADPTGALELEAVKASRFAPNREQTPNFGFTQQTYWAKVTLQSQSVQETHWLLEYAYPLIDHLELFVVRPGGPQERFVTGDALVFGSRPLGHRHFVFPLSLKPNETLDLYLKIRAEDTLEIPLRLWNPQEFHSADHQSQLVFGLYFGMMAVMVLFNSFLFLLGREKGYLYYVAYSLSFTLVILTLTGFGLELLWPQSPVWNKLARPFFIGTTIFFNGLFLKALLEPQKALPRLDKALSFLMGLGLLCSVLAVAGQMAVAIVLGVAVSILAAGVALLVGLLRFLGGYQAARLYLAGWSSLLLGIILYCLRAFGLVEPNFWVNYGLMFGSAVEVVLLSLAMADRMSQLSKERHEAQEETHQVQKLLIEQLQETDRIKNEFLQNMTHELRTPLNGMLGTAHLLASTPLNADQRELVEVIGACSQSLTQVIGDILDLAKIQRGAMQVVSAPFDPTQELESLSHLFGPAAREKKLDLRLELSNLPKTLVGDAHKLGQICSNLVSNALKFTSQGKVRLKAKVAPQTADQVWLEVEVTDTGIGIDKALLPQIFKPFTQGDSSLQKSYQGAGLGLTVVRQLVGLMNGEISLTSEPGKGTQVRFSLPFVPVAEVESASSEGSVGKKVLVLEPDPVNRLVLGKWFETKGCVARLCENADQAQRLSKYEKFDLLLVDQIFNPTGEAAWYDTLRAGNPQVPVVALTHHPSLVPPGQTGPRAYLVRPYTTQGLEAALNPFLGG